MRLFGNKIFLFSAGRSNPCSKSEGYELPPSETHNSYALSGAEIYLPQDERSNNLTAIFQRFLFGFVPLLPWGILPWCDTPTSGLPPALSRKGSSNSPQRCYCIARTKKLKFHQRDHSGAQTFVWRIPPSLSPSLLDSSLLPTFGSLVNIMRTHPTVWQSFNHQGIGCQKQQSTFLLEAKPSSPLFSTLFQP